MKKLIMLLTVFNVVIFCAGWDDSRKTGANAVREVWDDLCDDVRDGDVDGVVEHMTGAPKEALREGARETCAMYRQTGVLETIRDVRVEGDTAYLQTDMGYSIVFSKERGTWKYNITKTMHNIERMIKPNVADESNTVREVWDDFCDDVRDGDVDGVVEHLTGAPKEKLREGARAACAIYRQTGVLETIRDVRVEGDTAYLQTDTGYSLVFSKEVGTWKYNITKTMHNIERMIKPNVADESNTVREVWDDLCDDVRDGDVDGVVGHMTGAPKETLRECARETCAMYRQTGVLETIRDVRVEGDTAYLKTNMGYSIVFSKEGGTWKYNVTETMIKMMQ